MTASVKLGAYNEKIPGEYKVPDEDFYVMTLDDWDEPIRSSFIDKETGEYPLRINLKFKVQEDLQGDTEFADFTCSKYVDLDLNPYAKGSIWDVLVTLDPTIEPEPGMEIENYRGKKLIAEVVHKKKPSRDDPTKINTFANIGAIKPMKKKKAAPKPANALLTDDDE